MNQNGFTLIEVLVATAICGIALGVALSGISQGHRSMARAALMEDVGRAAGLVMHQMALKDGNEEIEGEIDGMPGWRYSVEFQDLVLNIKEVNATDERAEKDQGPIEIQDLEKRIVKIIPPRGREFQIVSWIKKK